MVGPHTVPMLRATYTTHGRPTHSPLSPCCVLHTQPMVGPLTVLCPHVACYIHSPYCASHCTVNNYWPLIMPSLRMLWMDREQWRCSSTIYNVGTTWNCVQSFTFWPFYSLCPGQATQPKRNLSKRNVSCPWRESNHDSSGVQLIAQSPDRLSYPQSLVLVSWVCEWVILINEHYSNALPWQIHNCNCSPDTKFLPTSCSIFGYDSHRIASLCALCK